MLTVVQAPVRLGGGTSRELPVVQLALEGRTLLPRRELQSRVDGSELVRELGELRRRSLCVHLPFPARGCGIGVAGGVDGTAAERVAAPGKAGEGLRRGAALEPRAVEAALEQRALLVRLELERCNGRPVLPRARGERRLRDDRVGEDQERADVDGARPAPVL